MRSSKVDSLCPGQGRSRVQCASGTGAVKTPEPPAMNIQIPRQMCAQLACILPKASSDLVF